jgi:hypothetical protein
MKKFAIILLTVIWSVIALANPVSPNLFSELLFTEDGWQIELLSVSTWLAEFDSTTKFTVILESGTDTAIYTDIKLDTANFIILTPADLDTTLNLVSFEDSLKVILLINDEVSIVDELSWGPNGVISTPKTGQSICFGQQFLMKDALSYFLDNSPTIGYLNDESGILGEIKIKIINNRKMPISGVEVRFHFHKTAGWLTFQSDSLGQISDSLVSYLWPIKVVKYSYISQTFNQQIWPDSTIELNVILHPDPEFFKSFFPLQVRNIWIYDNFIHPFASRDTIEILDTTRIDGNKYFKVNDTFVRYDSLGNLVNYHNGSDVMFFPLTFPDTNTIVFDSVGTPITVCVNRDSESVTVPAGTFGDLLTVMWNEAIDATSFYTYSKDIGLVKAYYAWLAPQQSSLVYAKVNGTEYTSGIKTDPGQPEKYALKLANYPNPFNSSTTLKYHLTENGDVRLSVFDLSGRLVEELFSGRQSAGDYHYLWSGGNLPSGVYLINLTAGDQRIIQKCMLMK